MEKIKINLTSGSALEKPLVTAFNSNNASYVVLDNEINGTMGLPIILVSKLVNNVLTKIEDQNEWNAVKESLRFIISGNQVDYITLQPEINANDMFFSQLTLPVASFEALKNNYKPQSETDNTAQNSAIPTNPAIELNNITEPITNGINLGQTPINPEVNSNPMETPIINNTTNNLEQPTVQNMAQTVNVPEPEVVPNVEPVTPVMPSAPMDAQTVAPVDTNTITSMSNETPLQTTIENAINENITQDAPTIDTKASEQNVPKDFTADKEAFLKACENMFDALVAKFNNK